MTVYATMESPVGELLLVGQVSAGTVGCHELTALALPAPAGRPELFRSTIDMARHRFGSGQYRYLPTICPNPSAPSVPAAGTPSASSSTTPEA
jgi:hypothetical protein